MISERVGRVTYTGDGVTASPYAVDFPFFELDIYIDGVLLPPNEFSIIDGDGETGSVAFDVAPANGAAIVIVSRALAEQVVDLNNNTEFDADAVEKQLDRIVVTLNDILRDQTYSIRMPVYADTGGLLDLKANPNHVIGSDTNGVPTLYPVVALQAGLASAQEVLDLIKTVDGVGSGLDADLLDGNSSSHFATAAALIAVQNDLDTKRALTAQKNSIESDAGDLQLVGDTLIPAALHYYGTDSVGNRGFFPHPSVNSGGLGLSVTAFGALGDNIADDTAAINAAITAAAASPYKRVVYFPAGTYRVTSLIPIPAGVVLVGENRYSSRIRTTSAGANVITLNGARTGVVNLFIDTAITRTGGSYINITTSSSQVYIKSCDFDGYHTGITIPDPIAIVQLVDLEFNNGVATTGISIRINGGFLIHLDHVICRNPQGARPYSHVHVQKVEDLTITNSQLISGRHDLTIEPPLGSAVNLVRVDNTMFDDATAQAIRIAPAGTVNDILIEATWIKGGTEDVLITEAGGGSINNVWIKGALLVGIGEGVTANGASNVNVIGCSIGAHNVAISFNNIDGGIISGNIIGAHGVYGVNSLGIFFGGSTDWIIARGNLIRGNAVNTSGSPGANGVLAA